MIKCNDQWAETFYNTGPRGCIYTQRERERERERVKVILYTLSILQKTHLCFSLELAIISYFTTLVNQIGQIELILRAVAFTVAELPDQYLAIYNDEKTPNSLK